jgi:hypothetical protein
VTILPTDKSVFETGDLVIVDCTDGKMYPGILIELGKVQMGDDTFIDVCKVVLDGTVKWFLLCNVSKP